MRIETKDIRKFGENFKFFRPLFLYFGRKRNISPSSLVSSYLFGKIMNGIRALNIFELR